ncbi:MAG: M43 family zinc metalloprotease [Bacteroidota bacterium]
MESRETRGRGAFLKLFALLLIGLLGFFTAATGQKPSPSTPTLPANDWIRCYTQEYQELLNTNQEQEEFEKWLDGVSVSSSRQNINASFSLPIVVHIIHDGEEVGEGLNLSYDQILSQIEVLNEDFRKKPGTLGFNDSPNGADAQIEFCMAKVNPEGNIMEEPGVNRVNRLSAGFSPPPFTGEYLKTTIQPSTIWDPESYINIWVSALSSEQGRSILGLAQLPFVPSLNGLNLNRDARTDGLAVHYRVFGRIGNLQEPYTQGRTTTHEMGHFLGLIHVWGDGNCNVDDYCDDTPSSSGEVFGCPIFEESCGSRNMLENFMQYTDDICMNTFTHCQVDRMRIVLQNASRRANLLNSDRCQINPVTPIANFELSSASSCTGRSIQFVDRSQNAPNSWRWDFPGGSPSSSTLQNPSVFYSEPGTYPVSLTVSNSQGSDQMRKDGLITVNTAGRDTFFIQNFETVIGDWRVDNPDAGITWELFETGGNTEGVKSVRVQGFEYRFLGQKDRLITPQINLSGRRNVKLHFRHAYRPFSSVDRDSLNLFISLDGGNSFPIKVLQIAENGQGAFATNTPIDEDFIPIEDADWCGNTNGFAECLTVDLSQFAGEADVRVAFEVVNDFGNNIYLDDILLVSDCPSPSVVTSTPGALQPDSWQVYPNPVIGKLFVSYEGILTHPASFSLFNSVGQKVGEYGYSLGDDFAEINLDPFPAGSYIVRIQYKGETHYKKVLLHR